MVRTFNLGRTIISDLERKVDDEVRITGQVISARKHGKKSFIDLKDVSGNVQIIIEYAGTPPLTNIRLL